MDGNICKEIGRGVTGQWDLEAFASAFAFWGGGILIWEIKNDWEILESFFKDTSPPTVVFILIGFIFMLAASNELVKWANLSVLRMVEGYMPEPLKGIKSVLVKRVLKKWKRNHMRLYELSQRLEKDTLEEYEKREFAILDMEMSTYPRENNQILSFRIGNILRASELYPKERYGLNIDVVWPRLWFILPECAQKELSTARKELDERVRIFTWGIMFALWTVLVWWAILISIFIVWVAHSSMQEAAIIYGEMIRSAFDIYRFNLYNELHWPPPTSPGKKEKVYGEKLTIYLFRGIPPEEINFVYSNNFENKNRESGGA